MQQPHDQMRFSVIVPAYNEAAYLARALDSLLHQDYDGEYEVIVVDNSSDDTAAIAARYGVRVVTEPEQGVCAARQRGVTVPEAIIISPMPIPPSRDWLRTTMPVAESEKVVAVAGPGRYKDPLWWAKAHPTLLFVGGRDHALTDSSLRERDQLRDPARRVSKAAVCPGGAVERRVRRRGR
jgi:hypothetical protein